MPGPHQVRAGRLPGPHKVTGRLLLRRRDPHRGELVHPQQPRQVHRVPGVGLDPLPAGRDRFEGATTSHRTPAAWTARASPYPVGPAS